MGTWNTFLLPLTVMDTQCKTGLLCHIIRALGGEPELRQPCPHHVGKAGGGQLGQHSASLAEMRDKENSDGMSTSSVFWRLSRGLFSRPASFYVQANLDWFPSPIHWLNHGKKRIHFLCSWIKATCKNRAGEVARTFRKGDSKPQSLALLGKDGCWLLTGQWHWQEGKKPGFLWLPKLHHPDLYTTIKILEV